MARSGSEKRQRQHKVGVRLTDQEYALIKAQADRAGVSMADVFRYGALNMPPLRASRHPSVDRQEICRLIAVFGQVADGLHELELAGASPPEIEAMQRDVADLRAAALEALGRLP